MIRWGWNVLVGLDQLGNAVLGGDPDETISSRCGKLPRCFLCKVLCKALNLIDKNHCPESIEPDEGSPWPS